MRRGRRRSTGANVRWRIETKKGKERTVYYLPVLLLLFSMEKDEGYYAWVNDRQMDVAQMPKLKVLDRLDCTRIARDSLDGIVAKVKEWYERLGSAILVAQ